MTPPPPLLARSVEIILDNQDPAGSYIASPNFPPYRYSWFRDGAFIAEAMSRAGQTDSAARFHRWCVDVVEQRRAQVDDLLNRAASGFPVAPDEHLHTRYRLDGADSDEPWWTFQLDGYGTWLWALDRHLDRHAQPRAGYVDTVDLTVRYLAAFWHQPCYDWWEENPDQLHVSTLAAIAAGLRACGRWPELATPTSRLATGTADRIVDRITNEGIFGGHLTKWLGNRAVDASLISAFEPFRLFPPGGELARTTIARIERDLVPGGVHRYLDDVYYGGGQWILLAGFLGSYHAAVGDRVAADRLLAWMAAQADADGELPEQVNAGLLHPEHEQRWIAKWGPSAKPLLWSHAMLLTLAADLDTLTPTATPGAPT